MSEVVKPDLAISIELLLALMEDLEADWARAMGLEQHNEVASFGVFSLVGYCLALRGEEIMIMLLHRLMEYFEMA